jgi:hypothetical protein
MRSEAPVGIDQYGEQVQVCMDAKCDYVVSKALNTRQIINKHQTSEHVTKLSRCSFSMDLLARFVCGLAGHW